MCESVLSGNSSLYWSWIPTKPDGCCTRSAGLKMSLLDVARFRGLLPNLPKRCTTSSPGDEERRRMDRNRIQDMIPSVTLVIGLALIILCFVFPNNHAPRLNFVYIHPSGQARLLSTPQALNASSSSQTSGGYGKRVSNGSNTETGVLGEWEGLDGPSVWIGILRA